MNAPRTPLDESASFHVAEKQAVVEALNAFEGVGIQDPERVSGMSVEDVLALLQNSIGISLQEHERPDGVSLIVAQPSGMVPYYGPKFHEVLVPPRIDEEDPVCRRFRVTMDRSVIGDKTAVWVRPEMS